MERAARPEPARFQPRRPGNPLLAAGSDAKRSAQADQIIANKRGGDW
jgi:hypothetical protein